MKIVTLTTDFGQHDYYVGAMKGAILSYGVPALFVDITHDIKNYSIAQAAFVVRNTYQNFPEGTVHLIGVHNIYQEQPEFIAIYHDQHYFVGPDNGVFSLLFPQQPKLVYKLDTKDKSAFSIKNIFAKAVGHILNDRPFHEIGMPVEKLLKRFSLQPIVSGDQIRGSVVHIDNYGNVILNIDKPFFDRACQNRPFLLYFKRFDPITIVSPNYASVPVGEVLCLFNSANCLEIAVNLGDASTLFGLELDDTIQIDFLDGPDLVQ
ncbi:MAG: SAM-dependent chlorinase/fluorinase [Aureispira sp.]|nr:SAM-dependent chlorinase/fluorinase [Aureispira sp.]